jgi:hypothetical protein
MSILIKVAGGETVSDSMASVIAREPDWSLLPAGDAAATGEAAAAVPPERSQAAPARYR